MIEAAEAALRFAAGRKRTDIDHDDQFRFALVQAILIVSEAASRISSETQSAWPAIPWPDIIFMRNRLVHAYFDIDRDIVWQTVTEDIPAVLAQLRSIAFDWKD